jgi:hypothetical protein
MLLPPKVSFFVLFRLATLVVNTLGPLNFFLVCNGGTRRHVGFGPPQLRFSQASDILISFSSSGANADARQALV